MFRFSRRKRIPAAEADRIGLVRRLIKLRAEVCPEAKEFLDMTGIDPDEFDDSMVMMSAESGIMRIVEQYINGAERGATDDVIIPFLNQSHAQLVSQLGQNLTLMPPPFSLARYIRHFLVCTNQGGMQIGEQFIPIAIQAVYSFYGRRWKNGS